MNFQYKGEFDSSLQDEYKEGDIVLDLSQTDLYRRTRFYNGSDEVPGSYLTWVPMSKRELVKLLVDGVKIEQEREPEKIIEPGARAIKV